MEARPPSLTLTHSGASAPHASHQAFTGATVQPIASPLSRATSPQMQRERCWAIGLRGLLNRLNRVGMGKSERNSVKMLPQRGNF